MYGHLSVLCPCQTADKPYQDTFDHELQLLKERIRSCAQMRMESAVKELEEEERKKRLGPGGLDPVEVYASLPKVNHSHTHASIHRVLRISGKRGQSSQPVFVCMWNKELLTEGNKLAVNKSVVKQVFRGWTLLEITETRFISFNADIQTDKGWIEDSVLQSIYCLS